MRQIISNITRATPIAPLAVFRAGFGMIMLISIVRFIANGWVEQLYLEPGFFFTYSGFDWVRPLGAPGMYILFALMALGAAGIMLGWKYRFTAALFFFTFTYVELIDKTNYLNHYYFVSIIGFLLMLVPANRYFSLDVRNDAELLRTHVPAWTINIFKVQLGLVYFFAGMAKINPDWLIRAMPLKLWLAGKSNIAIVGWLFNKSWAAWVFSWAGMLYDLLVPFFLLNKRTRPFAYAAVVVFHLLTAALFKIGMFPYIMILSTLIFFPAAFHEKIISGFNHLVQKVSNAEIPGTVRKRSDYATSHITSITLASVLVLHFTCQLVLPLRHVLYPGNLFWTEEGYRFSWRVMLMEKAGMAEFTVRDSDGRSEIVDNSQHLTRYQEKMMATQPDMIVQYAKYLKEVYRNFGYVDPIITVDSYVSLNGHRSTAMVDPEINLAEVRYQPGHNFWITRKPE